MWGGCSGATCGPGGGLVGVPRCTGGPGAGGDRAAAPRWELGASRVGLTPRGPGGPGGRGYLGGTGRGASGRGHHQRHPGGRGHPGAPGGCRPGSPGRGPCRDSDPVGTATWAVPGQEGFSPRATPCFPSPRHWSMHFNSQPVSFWAQAGTRRFRVRVAGQEMSQGRSCAHEPLVESPV